MTNTQINDGGLFLSPCKVLSSNMFASLHNHSNKSLLDATLTPEEVVQQAYDLGFKAVAISEHGNMHSVIDGYKKAKELGINFIPACEIYETTDMDYKESDSDRYHLLLLAQNNVGYQNLLKIVSEGSTRGFYGKMRVDLSTIAKYSEGIIASSACLASRLMRLLTKGFCPCCGLGNDNHKEGCKDEDTFEPNFEQAKLEVEKYKTVFGENFYIELQSHDTKDQAVGNQRILELAKMTNTKTIITFDAHMRDGSEKTRDIHRKFVEISQQGREVGETYKDCYQQDMQTMYDILVPQIGIEAVNEAVMNTGAVGESCNVEIELHRDLMPKLNIPEEFADENAYLRHLINLGWIERGIYKKSKEDKQLYRERVENEIEVLEYLGFSAYFIMNKWILEKVKERGIPKGYSRGSGANSLCLYLLGVTEVDSIRWDLDFSRFANKGRKGSLADYDIDISKARRKELVEIIEDLFGSENVAHVATFNSLSPKVAIRDLGKVFDEEKIYAIPYATRDRISKLIPKDITIEEALEQSSELKKWEKKYPLLFEYTKSIQNYPKSVGTHASAIAVADRPLTELSAVMLNKDGKPMLHLEMHNMQDDLGVIKIDALGLATTDVVDDTLKLSGLTWDDINLETLDLNDEKVFSEIYGKGNTLGIFQMESSTASNMFKEIMPDNINDIFAVNAMNRPAVLNVGMDKKYIHYKNNPLDINYLHEDLRPIMEETNSIMIYQEQALKVFAIAGFPEDEQDTARRAIGKKIQEVMDGLYAKFHNGLVNKGWNEKQIEEIWKLIEVQAEYSFNKGHSTAYGLLSYVTAWLKYYYPTEFMTALLINDIGNYEETSKYIAEARKMNISILAPDINKSKREYTVYNNEILFGLESIKGVGTIAVDVIVEERNKAKFTSFKDFLDRCSVDTTTVIALIKSGAFGKKKIALLEYYANYCYNPNKLVIVKTAPPKKKMFELNLISSDEDYKDKEKMVAVYNSYKKKKHIESERSRSKKHIDTFTSKYIANVDMFEFDTLSFFLNENPFDKYISYFKLFEEYDDDADKVLMGGTITSMERKKQKNGGTYAYVSLLTPDGLIHEGMVFNSQLMEHQDIIGKGKNIVLLCKKSGSQFIISNAKSFDVWKVERNKMKKMEACL